MYTFMKNNVYIYINVLTLKIAKQLIEFQINK